MHIGGSPCTFERWQFRTPAIPWFIQQTPLYENPNTHIAQAIRHGMSIMDSFEIDLGRLGEVWKMSGRSPNSDLEESVRVNGQLMTLRCLQILRQGYRKRLLTSGEIRAVQVGTESSLILEGLFDIDEAGYEILLGAFLVMGEHIYEIARFVIDHGKGEEDILRMAYIKSNARLPLFSIGLGMKVCTKGLEVCEMQRELEPKSKMVIGSGRMRTHEDPCYGSTRREECDVRLWPQPVSRLGSLFTQARKIYVGASSGRNSGETEFPRQAVSY